ncbi:MAG: hypothetical protein B7Y41_10135 [Hydrogenophilales bacterium 28-61-23]|nr:MAG: hypothetical protein B7Y41_10135 [Hydrogenophilales bacterium 28-61-23]
MKMLALVPLICALSAGEASATSSNYTNFSSITGLTLNGDAAQAGNVLRLVPSADTKSGTAFLTAPIFLDGTTGFSTAFEFNVTTATDDPTDGFTFLLQNDAGGVNSLGEAGQGLGYVGLTPSVAVVFRGRNPNLIGVITGGVDPAALPTPFQPAGYYSGTEGEFYNQNEFAWIDYDASTKNLSVYLSTSSAKPGTAIMSTTVDIFSTLGSQAYVGFSAGNGGAYGSQDILNWSFTSPVPEPETYAMLLAGLGLVGWQIRRRAATV